MALPFEVILFGFLIAIAIVIANSRYLFAAAMLTGIFSLVSAGLFTLMDAVDVAFTEAAVGAGISTILILGTLSLTEKREYQQPFRVMPILVVGITGIALFYGTLDMPTYGDPAAPIHRHVMDEFIRGTAHEFQIPNIVTAVLGSYRGYDTLGETTVIFAATVGVLLILGGRAWKRLPADESSSSSDETEETA